MDEETSPLVELGLVLSRGNVEVANEMRTYETRPEEYANDYARPFYVAVQYSAAVADTVLDRALAHYLEQRGAVDALIESLGRTGHLARVDHKEDPVEVLAQLDRVSSGLLSTTASFQPLVERYRTTGHGIGEFLDPEPSPGLPELAQDVGLTLEALRDESDSYALVLIPTEDLDIAFALAQQADVDFYFQWRRSLRPR